LAQETGDVTDAGSAITDLVRQVHAADGKLCIVVTGAGTQALAWLFSEPGASRTVLDAQVPYAAAAVEAYKGRKTEQHVSASEAMALAEDALRRAAGLAKAEGMPAAAPLAGVSCTAAITTDRVRRGENRCHVGLATSAGLRRVTSLVMVKGARDRAGEEALCSLMVLNAVAEAKGVSARLPLPLVDGERPQIA
jgi:hypothetical protein